MIYLLIHVNVYIFFNIYFNIYAHTFLGILTLFKIYGSCCVSFVFISYCAYCILFFATNLFVYCTCSSSNISNGG